jgi:hypothetical protein
LAVYDVNPVRHAEFAATFAPSVLLFRSAWMAVFTAPSAA